MTGINYYYHFSYDSATDQFWAYIDDGTKDSKPIFCINDTEEICDYIKTGEMSHIDDAEGLEDFLKQQGFLGDEDSLLVSEEMLW